ncbi:MAG TPA: hypothetical protein DD490_34520 [Acidobacteria bacterium]|nr:hypothetical protein [Acidobacteriota bacterium]
MTEPSPGESVSLEGGQEGPPLEPCYVLEVGGIRFALPLEALQRVHRIDEVTPVPRAPQHVTGVALVQNEVVACLDLGCLAGRGALPPGPCIAALVDGPGLRAALLAREVGAMTALDPLHLRPLPAELAQRLGAAARGHAVLEGGKAAAVVLDLAGLLAPLPRWTPVEAAAHGG